MSREARLELRAARAQLAAAKPGTPEHAEAHDRAVRAEEKVGFAEMAYELLTENFRPERRDG